ncbi:hypothetical protein [Actinophytocola sp. KF-1]
MPEPPAGPPQARVPEPEPAYSMTERLLRRRRNRQFLLAATVSAAVVLGGVALSAGIDDAGQDPGFDDAGAYAYPPAADPATGWDTPVTSGPAPDGGLPGAGLAPSGTAFPDSTAPLDSTSADAGTQLRELADADMPVLLSGVEGQWVAQLSSKRLGMVVDGVRYDDDAILDDHMALRASYSDVRLLWSGDWATFSSTDFWVTIVAVPYATPEAANAWCDGQGLSADACYAKRVGMSGGGDGNTLPR